MTHDIRPNMIGRIAAYVEASRKQPPSTSLYQPVFRCIFDLAGAAAAGIGAAGAIAAREAAREIMRAGNCGVWFTGQSSSAVGAAWANSAAASALDLDDGHRLARGHPGAAVIPTALAVGQETDATTEALVKAIVIGYEVGVTIAAARSAYGNTGVWSPYAVVATAGALRGTSVEVLMHALAIAGESAPNQAFASAPAPQDPAPEGSDVKEGIPWSVVTGLTSLSLAEKGHTGPRNILDDRNHYCFTHTALPSSPPHILNTYFKFYACCRHVHAPLDAMLFVMSKNRLSAGDAIRKIRVHTTSGALRISNKVHPKNLVDIQYSIPYCMALVALRGPESLLPLTDSALANNEPVIALAKKISLHMDDEFDSEFPAKTMARVTINYNGEEFSSPATEPRGEATHPASWPALEAKFRSETGRVASAKQQTEIITAIHRAFTSNDLRGIPEDLKRAKLVQ